MSSSSSSRLLEYRQVSKTLVNKLQTNRCAENYDLLNIYMEAVVANMPPGFISMMENIIGDVEVANTNKLMLDVKQILQHNRVIKEMQNESQMLKQRRGEEHKKKQQELLVYCCNKVVTPLVAILCKEREHHVLILENIVQEIGKMVGDGEHPFYKMAQQIYVDRVASNNEGMAEDAIVLQQCS